MNDQKTAYSTQLPDAHGTHVLLIRDGEGHANIDRVIARLVGCNGLTATGRSQVDALANRWLRLGFRPDVLVSSRVRRARETAEILAEHMPGLKIVDDCAAL